MYMVSRLKIKAISAFDEFIEAMSKNYRTGYERTTAKARIRFLLLALMFITVVTSFYLLFGLFQLFFGETEAAQDIGIMLIVFDLPPLVLLIMVIVYLFWRRHLASTSHLFIVVIILFFASLIFAKGFDRTGSLWYFLLPLFSIYLLGFRTALPYLLIAMPIAVLMFWLSENYLGEFAGLFIEAPGKHNSAYTGPYIVSFLITYVCLIIPMYAFERMRLAINLELEKTQKELRTQTTVLHQKVQDLHLTQNQLLQSEKMAVLGHLVTGMAHEINTPIGISMTAVSHMQDETQRLEDDLLHKRLTEKSLQNHISEQRSSLALTHKNIKRAADLISRFKQIAVDHDSETRRMFNLYEYIQEIITSLKTEIDAAGHDLEIDCPANLHIFSYPDSYAQIISNLLLNSIHHAYDEDTVGKIHVEIKYNGNLKIRFNDDGVGIPLNEQKKIFDPFYTTRRGAGGKGLGLSVVYNQVTQKLNGSIRCISSPGNGSSFIIEIPESDLVNPLADKEIETDKREERIS
jgi:signal transduction histidine kinase